VDVGLVGDVQATLAALAPRLAEKSDGRHLEGSLEHYRDARKGLDDLASEGSGRTPMHPQYVTRVVDELAADDASSRATSGPRRSGRLATSR